MAQQTIMKAYRGVAASLPTLEAGQLGFTTDTEVVYIGDGATNHQLMMASVHVHQVAHGLSVGNVIYCSGANAYTKANAAAAATADVVGVVSIVAGNDDFIYCAIGKMLTGVPAVAAGTVLFLSDSTAGALTATEPTAVGHISLPIAIVTENAVSMIVYSWRGMEIGTAGSGDVIGPSSATDGHLAVFDSTTGKLIKDGGACTAAGLALLDDANATAQIATLGLDADIATLSLPASTTISAAGAALIDDASAAAQLVTLGALPLAGGTMTGNLIMDNMNVTLIKLLTLHGEIDDGNSSTADTINWNTGTAHKSTLTGNVTFTFTGGTDTVPLMTSNTAPSGICSASSVHTTYAAWKAFNNNTDDYDCWFSEGVGVPAWIRYQFAAATEIDAYSLVCNSNAGYGYPTAWTLEGSANGADWTVLDTRSGQSFTTKEKKTYSLAAVASYAYYQLNISAVTGTTYIEILEMELLTGAITDPSTPCFLTLKLVQDGTGGRTVTWPSTVKGSPVINHAINSTSNVLFYWDGTNYYTLNGLPWVTAPAASAAAGFPGQMAWDASYIYVCTAANTWERAAIATWA